jgi:hypothetical protein
MTVPTDFAQLIGRIAGHSGPAVSWHGADGAMLEPTGAVIANWVYKATGLLRDFGCGPRVPLLVVTDGTWHWRSLSFSLAAWAIGAPVIFTGPLAQPAALDGYPAHLALAEESCADTPATAAADEVLVYPTAPLALDVEVPDGFTDAVSAMRAHPDTAVLPPLRTLSWAPVGGTVHELALTGARTAPLGPEADTGDVLDVPGTDAELLALLGRLGTGVIGLGSARTAH